MPRTRLARGDISLREIFQLSNRAYSSEVDNKAKRADIDVLGAKQTHRNNLERKEGRWVQTGREVKLTFMIRTNPTSYKKTDSIVPHVFPVVFLLKSINLGADTPFRWRTGSNAKPKFPDKKVSDGRSESEKDKIRAKNKRISEGNIKARIQMQFFFDLMQVLDMYSLLYGPNTTNRKLPKKANPKLIPFFDKHAYFIAEKLVIPLLTTHRHLLGDDSNTASDD